MSCHRLLRNIHSNSTRIVAMPSIRINGKKYSLESERPFFEDFILSTGASFWVKSMSRFGWQTETIAPKMMTELEDLFNPLQDSSFRTHWRDRFCTETVDVSEIRLNFLSTVLNTKESPQTKMVDRVVQRWQARS